MFCSMVPPMQRISELAEGQWGLFTTRQAQQAGVGWSSFDFLHREGLLDRVAHGVYRVRATGEPDHLALRAAWLQLDPATPAWLRLEDPDVALVSHASAASLYGIGDLRADVHEFTLPKRRQTSQPDVRLHRGTVPDKYRIILRGLPVTRAGVDRPRPPGRPR
jgi:predicted transcriptional regulator of viral defense system